jgi:hypothetical protein
MYENIGDGVASDMHVGIGISQDPADDAPCPTGSPAGRPVSFGFRVPDVASGATTIVQSTISKRTRIECISTPPLSAPQFVWIEVKVGDISNIVGAGVTVTGSGGPALSGVDGTEFLPYGTCANYISGQCMDMGEPLIIAATNISGVAATFSASIKGKTVSREQIR